MYCCCSQAVVGLLEQRGLTPDMVDIFTDSSNVWLPLSSECAPLAGSVLRVRGMCMIHEYNTNDV